MKGGVSNTLICLFSFAHCSNWHEHQGQFFHVEDFHVGLDRLPHALRASIPGCGKVLESLWKRFHRPGPP